MSKSNQNTIPKPGTPVPARVFGPVRVAMKTIAKKLNNDQDFQALEGSDQRKLMDEVKTALIYIAEITNFDTLDVQVLNKMLRNFEGRVSSLPHIKKELTEQLLSHFNRLLTKRRSYLRKYLRTDQINDNFQEYLNQELEAEKERCQFDYDEEERTGDIWFDELPFENPEPPSPILPKPSEAANVLQKAHMSRQLAKQKKDEGDDTAMINHAIDQIFQKPSAKKKKFVEESGEEENRQALLLNQSQIMVEELSFEETQKPHVKNLLAASQKVLDQNLAQKEEIENLKAQLSNAIKSQGIAEGKQEVYAKLAHDARGQVMQLQASNEQLRIKLARQPPPQEAQEQAPRTAPPVDIYQANPNDTRIQNIRTSLHLFVHLTSTLMRTCDLEQVEKAFNGCRNQLQLIVKTFKSKRGFTQSDKDAMVGIDFKLLQEVAESFSKFIYHFKCQLNVQDRVSKNGQDVLSMDQMVNANNILKGLISDHVSESQPLNMLFCAFEKYKRTQTDYEFVPEFIADGGEISQDISEPPSNVTVPQQEYTEEEEEVKVDAKGNVHRPGYQTPQQRGKEKQQKTTELKKRKKKEQIKKTTPGGQQSYKPKEVIVPRVHQTAGLTDEYLEEMMRGHATEPEDVVVTHEKSEDEGVEDDDIEVLSADSYVAPKQRECKLETKRKKKLIKGAK